MSTRIADMWRVQNLTAIDPKGNSITVTDKKITVVANLDNGIRVTKTFTSDLAPPYLHASIKDFIEQLYVDAFKN